MVSLLLPFLQMYLNELAQLLTIAYVGPSSPSPSSNVAHCWNLSAGGSKPNEAKVSIFSVVETDDPSPPHIQPEYGLPDRLAKRRPIQNWEQAS